MPGNIQFQPSHAKASRYWRLEGWIPYFVLAAAYWAAAVPGLQWTTAAGLVSPVSPASGVALAGMLLGGARLWPAVAIASLAAGLVAGAQLPLWAQVVIALGNSVSVALPVFSISRFARIDPRLTTLRDILILGLAALVSAALAATIGAGTLWLCNNLEGGRVAGLWRVWWFAAFTGALLISALILSWRDIAERGMPLPDWLHLSIIVIVMIVLCYFALIHHAGQTTEFPFILRSQLFPVMIWAALAFHVRGATLVLLIIAAFSVWGATLGETPLAPFLKTTADRIMFGNEYIALASISTLILASVADERRGKELLRESEMRARARADEIEAIFNGAPIGIAFLDNDFRVLRVNERLARMTGRPVKRHKGEAVEKIVPEFAEPLRTVRHRLLAGEEIPELEVSRFDRSEKAQQTWLVSLRPLPDASGKVRGVLGTVTDVTARHRAEKRERLLMREVNHRANNLLTLVQAVVSQTAAERDPREFAHKLSERLIGISASNDLLVKGAWEGVRLEDLVRAQLSPFADLLDHRIHISGPDVRVKPAVAQILGMALHELATNAAKYGALSTSAGQIWVEWSLTDGTTAPYFEMTWREAGGPVTRPPSRKGFGYAVIVEMVEYSLNGRVQLNFAPMGATWTFIGHSPDIVEQNAHCEELRSARA